MIIAYFCKSHRLKYLPDFLFFIPFAPLIQVESNENDPLIIGYFSSRFSNTIRTAPFSSVYQEEKRAVKLFLELKGSIAGILN